MGTEQAMRLLHIFVDVAGVSTVPSLQEYPILPDKVRLRLSQAGSKQQIICWLHCKHLRCVHLAQCITCSTEQVSTMIAGEAAGVLSGLL